jgi:sigma-B regulation protein RsbU (phosphoserine phosphatase)
VTLGAFIGLPLGAALLVRPFLSRHLVESHPPTRQPLRQISCDHFLFLAAGAGVVVSVISLLDVPFSSGAMFFLGFMGFGFFMAVDLGLARERQVIHRTLAEGLPPRDPGHLYPRATKFFVFALIAMLYVKVITSLIISRDLTWLKSLDPERAALLMPETITVIFQEMAFVMVILLVIAVNIISSYSRNLRILFETETRVLKAVSRGDLSRLVPVATNDEFGIIAAYTNTMIHALRDRIRILSNLKVAREVQSSLLPGEPPRRPGLDMSGTILYCEEVGGDSYDYLTLPGDRVGVAVTDSTGHGVGSALHMTTARALLRFGARHYRDPSTLIREVNTLLAQDLGDTGRFTTVFFLEIDVGNRTLAWVRAGHEPAFLFDPMTQVFSPLTGRGMALGVSGDPAVEPGFLNGWEKESIILIASDGLKETRNENQVMYGEQRIRSVIRRYCTEAAADIRDFLIQDLSTFRGSVPLEDDITLVIIKLD